MRLTIVPGLLETIKGHPIFVIQFNIASSKNQYVSMLTHRCHMISCTISPPIPRLYHKPNSKQTQTIHIIPIQSSSGREMTLSVKFCFLWISGVWRWGWCCSSPHLYYSLVLLGYTVRIALLLYPFGLLVWSVLQLLQLVAIYTW